MTTQNDTAALDFDRPAAASRLPFRVRARLNGWPVEVELTMPPAKLGPALDRLAELGFTPDSAPAATAPAAPQRPPRAPLPDVVYKPDGTPCCPWHMTPLREGQHGHYCPSRETDPERSNPKGYCRFSAKDL